MTSQAVNLRVTRAELSYEDDARYHYQGAWFTGWAVSNDRGFREEQEFRYGFRWGPGLVYAPDGHLIQESNFRMDLLHGIQREWEEGRLTQEARYEHGILVREREWDASGRMTKDFERPDDDAHLLKMRASFGTPEQVRAEEEAFRGGGTGR
jgi:hypothetical protein